MTIKRNLTQLKARQQNTISNHPPARNEGSEGDIVARMTNKGPILYAKLQGQWHAFKGIGTSVKTLSDSTGGTPGTGISNTTGVANNGGDSDAVVKVTEFENAIATLVLKINEIIRRLV